MSEPRRTPLYDRHVASGGKMIDFGGWVLPVQYVGIVDEHKAVRSGVGLFDVSHMGEVRFRGKDAQAAVQRLVTNDVGRLVDSGAQYTCACYEDGGIVDDCIVYRHAADDFLIVVNASNAKKDFDWFVEQTKRYDVCVTDESNDTALLAVQGPRALATLSSLSGGASDGLASFHFRKMYIAGAEVTLARTGYTGEDGGEIFCAPFDAPKLWDALLAAGVRPIGLGARDTLRLEAKLSLYGNDIDAEHTPYEAGLAWVVKGKGFVGEQALARQKAHGVSRRLVGFVMQERGIARHGYAIVDESGAQIGVVTSGTTGPTVDKAVGLGYVPADRSEPGTALTIDCRGKKVRAEVVKGAFYKRA